MNESRGDEPAVRLVGAVGHLDAQGLHLFRTHVGGVLGRAARFGPQQGVLRNMNRVAWSASAVTLSPRALSRASVFFSSRVE